MHPAKRVVPLGSLLLSAVAALYACDSGNGGGSAFDSGEQGYPESGPAIDVGASSSGGGASGSSSSSSGAMVIMCAGCIDLSGRCQSGTADNKCGKNSSTCVDCAGFSPAQVCGAAAECIAAPPDAASGSDSGSDGAGGSDGAADASGATDATGAADADSSVGDGSAPVDDGGAG